MHEISLRVYYEDTDLAGIVYYANYLKYIVRARSDWVRDLGIDQRAMREEFGMVFAVRRAALDYISPARFDDWLTVRTEVTRLTGARLELMQSVLRKETLLLTAAVTLVCLDPDARATRLPENLRRPLELQRR